MERMKTEGTRQAPAARRMLPAVCAYRVARALTLGAALLLIWPAGAAAQSSGGEPASGAPSAATGAAADWTPPRTAWGAPDLQGVWDYRTLTPLQRPREFADRETLTAEEAAAYEERQGALLDDYDRAPSVHAKWWLDYGRELTDDRRTSLLVDPPGRAPPGGD